MWKKTDDEPTISAAPRPQSRAAQPAAVASLGPSIFIKGDLTGEEDLIIRGRVEGEVRLKDNNVTVGESGKIKADIYGKSIRVEGQVKGNLYGGQEVVIRASGRVQGNIVSPRVTLENGSKFKGAIDMEPAGEGKSSITKPSPQIPVAAKPGAAAAGSKPASASSTP